MTDLRKITVEELHAEMKAQQVSSIDHVAFKCVVCGTVQSLASFKRAGVEGEQAERYLGFSCVGRFTDAGPWNPKDKNRRKVPGCDWTLGGFFRIHRLIVVTPDGEEHPSFELATPEEAQALMARDGKTEPRTEAVPIPGQEQDPEKRWARADRRRTSQQRKCDAFNAKHPMGTSVRYWTGPREGEGRVGKTRTAAEVLSGHTAVVWIEGCTGRVALTHVKPTRITP